jgi:hypothetical protein|tara:strand:- start:56 stop:1051 length:996 start_codon:yes stop_codon:yes gene_type:complete
MSRFGTKEILNYWAGTDQYLDYNFIPGVQTETMGRQEFYADFMCSTVYAWSEYLPDKLVKHDKYVHLGACPFLYADALVPRQERQGTCIFLPKIDVATGVDFNQVNYDALRTLVENAPRPVVAMAPAEQKQEWYHAFAYEGLKNLHIMSIFDDPGVEEWQLGLAVAMGKFQAFYFPMFTSATMYAYYSGAHVRYYDAGNIYYETGTSSVNSYAKLEDIHTKFENLWIDRCDDRNIIMSMIKLFLCPHKRQTPDELLESLYMLNFRSNIMTEKHGRHWDDWFYGNSTGTIIPAAVPLELYSKDKALDKLNAKCKIYDTMEYHPAVKKLITEL